MMRNRIGILIFVLLLIFITNQPFAQNRPGMSLKETFDLYVKSFQNSDLEGLFSTVTHGEEFTFLTSRGEIIDSREEYYKFHEGLFQQTGWEMPVELLEVYEGTDYGYTIAVYHYKIKTPDGGYRSSESYFTLIFRKEDGMWKVVVDVSTPIKKTITAPGSDIQYTPEQEYLFGIIQKRRTVRAFKSEPVPEEHILKILDAARMAPTAGNQQPWKFLVIRDREKLDKLQVEALGWYLKVYKEKMNPSEADVKATQDALKGILENVLSAPVYVAVLADSEAKHAKYIDHDGPLAAGYLMIAARALGYGSGYFTTFFPEDQMRTFFRIPEKYKLVCFTPIGIPADWPEAPEKKPLDEMVIFEDFE
jgi:nitroreductase/ketosteroid isomerase-like protein